MSVEFSPILNWVNRVGVLGNWYVMLLNAALLTPLSYETDKKC